MNSLSIRDVDPQLAAILEEKARKSQKSIDQLVVEILRQHVGLMKEKRFTREYDDLDHLFGRWSDEEYTAIQGKIDHERQIDKDLWE